MNKHWARFARIFDLWEVNLMEKQLLFLLDFNLIFSETDLLEHMKPLFDTLRHYGPPKCRPSFEEEHLRQANYLRKSAIQVVSRASSSRLERQASEDPPPPAPNPSIPLSAAHPIPPLPSHPVSSHATRSQSYPNAPTYTNVHMHVPSDTSFASSHVPPTLALNDILSRGPSTDSFNSSNASSTGGLTEDSGMSSSSSATSEDEAEGEEAGLYDYCDDKDVVRVQPTLRPCMNRDNLCIPLEQDISTLRCPDHEGDKSEKSGLAGIGTIVAQKVHGVALYPAATQRLDVRGTRRRSRGSMYNHRRSETTVSSSSEDEDYQYPAGEESYRHALSNESLPQRPSQNTYASSTSTITAVSSVSHRNSNSHTKPLPLPRRSSNSNQPFRYSVAIATATPPSSPVDRICPAGSRPAPAHSRLQSPANVPQRKTSSLARSFSGMGIAIASAPPLRNRGVSGFGASIRNLLGGGSASSDTLASPTNSAFPRVLEKGRGIRPV